MVFDTTLISNIYENPLFIILADLIKYEINHTNNSSEIFSKYNLVNEFICGYTKRIECQQYVNLIYKDFLEELANQTEILNLNPLDLYEQLSGNKQIKLQNLRESRSQTRISANIFSSNQLSS